MLIPRTQASTARPAAKCALDLLRLPVATTLPAPARAKVDAHAGTPSPVGRGGSSCFRLGVNTG